MKRKKSLVFISSLAFIGGMMSSIASADSVKVSVNGMVCGFCAQGITKKLENTQSVEKINVDLEKKVVSFQTRTGKQFTDEAIQKLMTDAGYVVVKIEREKQ